MARIPNWTAAIVVIAALISGTRAYAQSWSEVTTRKAVSICIDGHPSADTVIKNAQAAGWSAFDRKLLDDGMELRTSFNTRPPIANDSPFVMIQVGTKTAMYGVRMRQVACAVSSRVPQRELLATLYAERFPGFAASPNLWFGRRNTQGVISPLPNDPAQLQNVVSRLAPGEAMVTAELGADGRTVIGTVRFYERLP